MATTKGKVSSSSSSTQLGKEIKKTAVPSNSRTASAATAAAATKSRANTASTTTNSAHHKASSTSTTDKKQVPCYLRPTISSRNESFKYVVKKSGPEDHTKQKATPTYTRRRSFDKPQTDSRLRSALVSPGPRVRTLTIRSTSFSPRSSTATNSLEPSGERTSKTPTFMKVGRAQASHAKTKKRSTNPISMKEIIATVSTETPKNVDTTDALSHQSVEEGGDFLVREVEEVVKVEGEGNQAESANSEVTKYENDRQTDAAESEAKSGEDEKLESYEIPEVSEEMSANLDAQIEEAGDKIPEVIKAENPNEGEAVDGIKEVSNESHQVEESVASKAKVEVKDQDIKGEDQDAYQDKVSGGENKSIEDNMVDEKEGMDGGSEGLNSKEGDQDVVLEGVVEETTPVVAGSTTSSNRQVGQGKKESPAYNDVIEETASKPLEERKNKVKALVGAFETVIDKEASSK